MDPVESISSQGSQIKRPWVVVIKSDQGGKKSAG